MTDCGGQKSPKNVKSVGKYLNRLVSKFWKVYFICIYVYNNRCLQRLWQWSILQLNLLLKIADRPPCPQICSPEGSYKMVTLNGDVEVHSEGNSVAPSRHTSAPRLAYLHQNSRRSKLNLNGFHPHRRARLIGDDYEFNSPSPPRILVRDRPPIPRRKHSTSHSDLRSIRSAALSGNRLQTGPKITSFAQSVLALHKLQDNPMHADRYYSPLPLGLSVFGRSMTNIRKPEENDHSTGSQTWIIVQLLCYSPLTEIGVWLIKSPASTDDGLWYSFSQEMQWWRFQYRNHSRFLSNSSLSKKISSSLSVIY